MDQNTKSQILKFSGAKEIIRTELIQKLWNNYGELLRVYLRGGERSSVILKHIKLPAQSFHPKGFNTSQSKQRKIHSYQVEVNWYENYNPTNRKVSGARTADKLTSFQKDGEVFILLEDLDESGYCRRITEASYEEIKLVLSWLARFHATFMEQEPVGLWQSGTYWHLETRPDELQELEDQSLKEAAELIDRQLKTCSYLTLVHGDAKLANFCFSNDLLRVAAVDFQYVGSGCGMKDVAYFIGSCLDEDQCEALEADILDFYFRELINNIQNPQIDKTVLESQWRALYRVAWADFHRFLKGWSPWHWKINSYSEKVTREVVDQINQTLLSAAKTACVEAGKKVMEYWQQDFKIETKAGSTPSSSIVTEVDFLSQEIILSHLKPTMEAYDLGLLSEESPDDYSRQEKELFWSVDPLDGTLPYSEGKPGFAISIALINREGVPLIGCVYDPVTDTLFHSVKNRGSYRNNHSIEILSDEINKDPIHLFADWSLKQSPNFSDLTKLFIIHFGGGAVMNSINLLLNPNSCYFKYPKKEQGGCAIWDLAAVSLILEEAGGIMANFKGQPLSFNQAETIFFNREGEWLVVTKWFLMPFRN
jgi:3'-phosphoadenosine 5'-phosphosulfate (PAPS) 3'-phosphatase